MFADISQPPAPLPTAAASTVCDGVTVLPPLSRRGYGPGLVLLLPDGNDSLTIVEGIPPPMVKWAEEGYTVVAVQARALANSEPAAKALGAAVEALQGCVACEPKEKMGLVGMHNSLVLPHSSLIATEI
jgi:carboxymethylenebutenolidase